VTAAPTEQTTTAGAGAGSPWRKLRTDALFGTSVAIMASTVLTSGLGYLLWLVVARAFGQQVSGEEAAITSLMMAVSLLAAVGAAAAMIQWLPQATDAVAWRRRVTAGLVATTGLSIVGGLLAVAVMLLVTDSLPALRTGAGAALFVTGVLFTALGTLYDYVCVSEQRGAYMLLRNGIASLLRLPLIFLPFVVDGQPMQILLAWTASAALSLVVAVPVFRGRSAGRTLLRPVMDGLLPELRLMGSSVVGQHLITVTAMLGAYLLPVVVVDRLSAVDNAYFYITWMLGSLFSIISPAVSTALFASAAADPAQIRAATRRSLLIIGGLLTGPILAYLLGGRLLLGLFGDDYAEHGALLLVLLTAAAIPDAITNVAVAVLRATDRIAAAVWLNGLMLLGTLLLSFVLLPVFGIVAVGISWLVAQSVGAVWAAFALRGVGARR
jgi:O-antigen/teichoic acid export membrane protein